MTLANRVPATMAPVTAPPTVPNWEAQLLDRAPLVLVFAVCLRKLVVKKHRTIAPIFKIRAIHRHTIQWVHAS